MCPVVPRLTGPHCQKRRGVLSASEPIITGTGRAPRRAQVRQKLIHTRKRMEELLSGTQPSDGAAEDYYESTAALMEPLLACYWSLWECGAPAAGPRLQGSRPSRTSQLSRLNNSGVDIHFIYVSHSYTVVLIYHCGCDRRLPCKPMCAPVHWAAGTNTHRLCLAVRTLK